MLAGSGRSWSSWLVPCIAAVLACGRTVTGGAPELEASGAGAGVSASGAGEPAAGGRPGVAAGSGGAPGGGSAVSDAGSPDAGILVYDGVASRVGVVGDRDGNALVHWDVGGGQVQFARWDAAEQAWQHPPAVLLADATVVDTYGSGHPILIGDELDTASGDSITVVRRFDARRNEWGPAQPTGIGGVFAYRFYLSMDGAGNVYAHWLSDDRSRQQWTWWPVDSDAWEPLRTIDHATRIVGARQAGAWLWQENSGFAVRAFDFGTGDWSEEHELEPRLGVAASSIHQLVVGPHGEALATDLYHEPNRLVLDAWRYDADLGGWQPKETALELASDDAEMLTYGPTEPITDSAYHDIVAVSRREGDEFVLYMNRREPSTGAWSLLHLQTGLRTSNGFELVADDSGNVFGSAPSGLFEYSATTGFWIDRQLEGGASALAASRRGAFGVGFKGSSELVAYRDAGGAGEWRKARGLPEGVMPEIGSVPYAMAPLGEERALVVWPTRESGRVGAVRAAFIE